LPLSDLCHAEQTSVTNSCHLEPHSILVTMACKSTINSAIQALLPQRSRLLRRPCQRTIPSQLISPLVFSSRSYSRSTKSKGSHSSDHEDNDWPPPHVKELLSKGSNGWGRILITSGIVGAGSAFQLKIADFQRVSSDMSLRNCGSQTGTKHIADVHTNPYASLQYTTNSKRAPNFQKILKISSYVKLLSTKSGRSSRLRHHLASILFSSGSTEPEKQAS
jgi:hypothetical protein